MKLIFSIVKMLNSLPREPMSPCEDISTGISVDTMFDIRMDCGIYRKSEIRETLEYLLAQKHISNRRFKFIVHMQKSKSFKILVQRLLFKFKPIFDISSTYTIPEDKVKSCFVYKSYDYKEVCSSCDSYAPGSSYFRFVENYDAIFNKNQVTGCPGQKSFVDDLLSLMKRFEVKRGKKLRHKRFTVRESLMFFVRDKSFNDTVRFYIFVAFRRGELHEDAGKKILDSELKWKEWKRLGFPKGYENVELVSERKERCENDASSKGRNSSKTFEEFLRTKNTKRSASEISMEWYSKRNQIFE